jgi:hypothetical protein
MMQDFENFSLAKQLKAPLIFVRYILFSLRSKAGHLT